MTFSEQPEREHIWQRAKAERDTFTAARDLQIYNLGTGSGRATADPAALPSVVPPLGQRATTPLRGRDDLVRELSSAASSGAVHVVHGLGGVGKTRLALEVASAVIDVGRQVWWVSAVDSASVSTGMQAVGYAAGATTAEFEHENSADVVWRHLGRYSDPWLLILDNADDPETTLREGGNPVADGKGWVRPVPGHGCLLVTSRDGSERAWGKWTRHRISPLGTEHGADVLLDLAPDGGTASEAALLARRLGGLPLALQLAGRAIAQAAAVPAHWDPSLLRSFSAYRNALTERFSDVITWAAPGAIDPKQARGLVGQTWELSLTVLDGRSIPEARPLLRLLSCFGDAPIPCGLLLDPATLAGSELFPALTGQRLWEVLTSLESLSLITLDKAPGGGEIGPMAIMHPLVRETNRTHPEVRDAAASYYQLVTDLLENADFRIPERRQDGGGWDVLAAHLADSVANPLADEPGHAAIPSFMHPLRWLANRAAEDLRDRAMYTHAETLYLAMLADDTRRLGGDHPDTLTTQHELAWVWDEQGRWADAERAYASVLAAREERLGGDHPDTLTTRQNLARVWSEQGRWAHAEQAFTSVLAIYEGRLGSDDPDTLAARHDLAVVWRDQGRWADAERAFTSVLAAREERLGIDHPDTLAARHDLARVWDDQGRWADAEQAYASVLAAREERLGSDHPYSLSARHDLAGVWREQGRWADAEQAYAKILVIYEGRLGSDHPGTTAIRSNLAGVWREQGRWADAEQTFAMTVEIYKERLGNDHPYTLTIRHNLAWVWDDLGRWADAEQAFTSVLAAREEQFGSNHPSTLSTRHNLAVVWHKRGRWADAERAFTSVLAAREERLGIDHPDTLSTRHYLAVVWHERGRWADAERAFTSVLAAREERLGIDHPDTVATREAIARQRDVS